MNIIYIICEKGETEAFHLDPRKNVELESRGII